MREKKNIIELTRISNEEYKVLSKLPLILMADNVRSAQNIGAMLRTSDAFLIERMIMAGISAVPPSKEIEKTSLGAEESVEWSYVADALEETKRMKGEGVKIFVLEQTHDSLPLQDLSECEIIKKRNKDDKFFLVVGNEVKGVDQRIVDLADVALEIPMHGIKHSLNVAVSAGLALWQFYQVLIDKRSEL